MTDENSISDEEKAKLQAAFGEIEKQFKARGVHGICLKVLAMLLSDDGVTWLDQWTPEIAKAFWALLEEAKAAKTHRMALDDLIMLAAYMQQKLHKPDLGAGLLILINEAVMRWKLVDLDVDAQFDAQAGDGAANTVTGGKDRAKPAKVGDKAPEGAVRPDQLGKGPRRI